MAQKQDGFFVPGSITGSYVSNKRNENDSPAYESQANQLGLQKQAALQALGKNYATTIENAYASYLAGKQGVLGSAMGEGFKDAYIQNQQQALIENVAQANQNIANVRAQLEQEETEAVTALQEQYKTDVTNLDKVAKSFENYRTYLQSLKNQKGESWFTDEQNNMAIEDMYQMLYEAQPQGLDANKVANWVDTANTEAMPYTQWLSTQLKDTTADANWYNWAMYQGGIQDFLKSARSRKTEDHIITAQREQEALEAEQNAKAEELIHKYTRKYNFDIGNPYTDTAELQSKADELTSQLDKLNRTIGPKNRNTEQYIQNQYTDTMSKLKKAEEKNKQILKKNIQKAILADIKQENYDTFDDYYKALSSFEKIAISDAFLKSVMSKKDYTKYTANDLIKLYNEWNKTQK